MSSVEKMMIRGIRSFSPEKEVVINFYKPLTIIVGKNGCGKTTIIESLRFAITGTLPPGTAAGKYFIHDPSMEDATETKAQIKMRFIDRSGNKMTVIRSSTLTKGKRGSGGTYKQLPAVLQKYNDEKTKKESVASKCSDIDIMLPELFGVSKAIIDNVIFCHQEDANWAMQEGMVLKKRFDEIFESARYTKALDSIKKKSKELSDNFKDIKKDLEIHDKTLERSQELNKQLDEANKKLDGIKETRATNEEELKKIDTQISELQNELRAVSSIKNQIETVDSILRSLREEVDRKKRNLVDNIDGYSVKDMESKINDLDSKYKANDQTIDVLKGRRERWKSDIAIIHNELSSIQGNIGSLKEKVAQFNIMKTDYNTTIHSIASTHEMSHMNTSSTNVYDIGVSKKILYEIERKRNGLRSQANEAKIKHDNASKDHMTAVNSAKLDEERAQFNLKNERQNLEKFEVDKSQIIASLHSLGGESSVTYEREMNKVEEQIANAEAQLKTFNERDEKKKINEIIANLVKDKTSNDFDIVAMKKVISSLERDSENRLQLQIKEQQIVDKESVHKQDLDNFKEEFYNVIKERPTTASGLVEKISSAISERKSKLEGSRKKLQTHEQKLSVVESQAKTCSQRVEKLNAQLKSYSGSLSDLNRLLESENKSFEELRTSLKAEEEQTKMSDAENALLIKIVRGMKSGTKKNKCCALCNNSLDDEEKMRKTVEAIDQRLENLKKKEESKDNARLEFIDRSLSLLEKCSNDYTQQKKIEDQEKPEELAKLIDLEQNIKTLKEEGIAFENQCNLDKNSVTVAEKLIPTASRLEQASIDIESLKRDVTNQKQYSSSLMDGGEITLEEAREKFDKLNENRERIQKEEQMQRNKIFDLQQSGSQLANIVISCKTKKTALQESNKQREILEGKKQEILEKEKAARSTIEILNRDIPKLATARNEVEIKMKQDLKTLLHNSNSANDLLNRIESDIKKMTNFIDRLENANKETSPAAKLSEEESKLNAKRSEIKSKQAESDKTEQEEEKLKQINNQIQSLKANLATNLDYLHVCEKLKGVEAEYKDLSSKYDAEEVSEINRKLSKIRSQREDTLASQNRSKGQKDVYTEEVKRCNEELKNNKYQNIRQVHMETRIKKETLDMAIKDLDKYYKALDAALMKYHTMKIEEINTQIRELWSKVYKGEDIDKIEIKSDPDESEGKRNYNYRVVMSKRDCELDMRGRCSAGQKVLACIVIRLALQDSFCANCGIMTLDEPTSNLDEANKTSLCTALSELIRERRNNKNFQLIIITHDDEFVQELAHTPAISSSGGTPFYLRVMREVAEDGRCYSRVLREEMEKI